MVADLFDPRFEFPEMGAGPVNLSALGTTAEIFVVNFRQRLELIEDFSFADLEEQAVALQATAVRSNEFSEIKAAHDFNDLLGGIVGARTIPMANDSVHEETAIARQQRAVLRAATGRERRIGSIR